MKQKTIPASETLAAHEEAAAQITELRRKGIHCHLEDKSRNGGHCIDVVVDPDHPEDEAPPREEPPTGAA